MRAWATGAHGRGCQTEVVGEDRNFEAEGVCEKVHRRASLHTHLCGGCVQPMCWPQPLENWCKVAEGLSVSSWHLSFQLRVLV